MMSLIFWSSEYSDFHRRCACVLLVWKLYNNIITAFSTCLLPSGFLTTATCDLKRKFRLYLKETTLASLKDKLWWTQSQIQKEILNFFFFGNCNDLTLRTVESSRASIDSSLFGVLRTVKYDSQIDWKSGFSLHLV